MKVRINKIYKFDPISVLDDSSELYSNGYQVVNFAPSTYENPQNSGLYETTFNLWIAPMYTSSTDCTPKNEGINLATCPHILGPMSVYQSVQAIITSKVFYSNQIRTDIVTELEFTYEAEYNPNYTTDLVNLIKIVPTSPISIGKYCIDTVNMMFTVEDISYNFTVSVGDSSNYTMQNGYSGSFKTFYGSCNL